MKETINKTFRVVAIFERQEERLSDQRVMPGDVLFLKMGAEMFTCIYNSVLQIS